MKKYIVKVLDSENKVSTKEVVADSYYGLETDIRFFKEDKLVAIFRNDMVESIKEETLDV